MVTVPKNARTLRASRPYLAPAVNAAKNKRDTPVLSRFVRAQVINSKRNAAALRPFRHDEFGTDPASPSEAHIRAANKLIGDLRKRLLAAAGQVSLAGGKAHPSATPELQHLLARKEGAERWIKLVEKIWYYYLELFGQRQTRFGPWLLASDRIALDCYQAVYTGLGQTRSIPSPPPFVFMETTIAPATFRRGIPVQRLGLQANPFPVVQLPYHRLVNPWTLGAIHHESSHNLQSDLAIWQEVPRRINRRLHRAGLDPFVIGLFTRWSKEMFADLCGCLLGGPAVAASLLDVLARSPATTQRFNPADPHPTPYLRILINLELLRRLGFAKEAAGFGGLWRRLYPSPRRGNIPRSVLANFPKGNRLVVDTICFQPYRQLGDKSLAQVMRFQPGFEKMIAEAARRLAAGNDPGIIPARYLVGAARWALDHDLARPERITHNFYLALAKR